jgi:hypothetical protein
MAVLLLQFEHSVVIFRPEAEHSQYYPYIHATEAISHLNVFMHKQSRREADHLNESHRYGNVDSCFLCG